ncbi:HTH domain protein [Fermentimonas caenicola]|jgi:predicted DNA-binding transcriptional regulator YafY|uniref:HTH domain protein n=1 Tax=Fermentimonas caenicola TaxID=1562970 RepID=A0A098C2W4_9BACT|nr:HTH domain protein [Fermentimonas caenicola]
MDQPKLERLLRLMKMLAANNYLTVEEIAARLSITPRSVYRYIDTFRSAGFVIKKKNGCIRLDKSSPYFKDISELIHFTEEEAYILKSAIESIDENNILKQNLKKKLYTVYDYKILAETIVNSRHSRNVRQLVQAMEERRTVILKKYASSHGNDIRDRRVEAFAFTTNYEQVWCYCLEDREVKLFRVSRIGAVEILPEPWQHEAAHQSGYIDIFRMHSNVKMRVILKMGLRSSSLLMEEYPLASKQMKRISDNEWMLDTEVCSYEGVGRFVLGLPGDIVIIDSPELVQYIANQVEKIKASP